MADHSLLLEPIHLVGIGGSGMSPLAEIAHQRGYRITGSDIGRSSTIDRLLNMGITVFTSQHADNLQGVKTVIVSSAIKDSNPELIAAKKQGLTIIHRSDFLHFLMQGKKAITIAGTHGKTTTSSLIAHMLEKNGLKPSAAIGGTLVEFNSSALCGDGAYFVAEADESDGSFLKYDPFISVLTNIDKDHMDYFKTFEDLLEAFKKYLSKTLPDGVCIIGWDNKNSQTIGYELQKPRLSFGRRIGSDIRLLSYEKTPGGLCFECMVDKLAVTCTLPLIGYHNMLNALCALAVAHAIGLDVKAAADSLASFRGVARRLETKYFSPQVKVFDDYAHNPGKVAACITGVREAYPAAKLHVIFQPHRYSRLETMYNEIVSAFLGADEVLILPVYAAGETAGADFSLELTGLDISKASNTSARLFKNFEECAEYAVNQVSDESIFLCLGAGDIWKLANTLGELFNAKQKKI